MQSALRPYWETFDSFHIEVEELVEADANRLMTVARWRPPEERFRIASSTFGLSRRARSSGWE
jgi:hypothetical protein